MREKNAVCICINIVELPPRPRVPTRQPPSLDRSTPSYPNQHIPPHQLITHATPQLTFWREQFRDKYSYQSTEQAQKDVCKCINIVAPWPIPRGNHQTFTAAHISTCHQFMKAIREQWKTGETGIAVKLSVCTQSPRLLVNTGKWDVDMPVGSGREGASVVHYTLNINGNFPTGGRACKYGRRHADRVF